MGACFTCGADGHRAAACPNEEVLDARPPWCQVCDRRTRLVTVDLERGTVRKCQRCHGAPDKPLAQHKRCTQCKTITYSWDNASECGSHQPVGQQLQTTGANKK